MHHLLSVGVILLATVAQAVGVAWKNLDDVNRVGGRKASEGYLQGKVVLVCREASMLSRMETVWQSFKTKPFVLIGAAEKSDPSCTFPQYGGAGLAVSEPSAPFYVVGETGQVVYKGEDANQATEAVVTALTDLESPRSEYQWRSFFDFELKHLPAHAYLRYEAFKKKHPDAAKEYADRVTELRAVKDVDKVATLVRLARQAKDAKPFGPKEKAKQVRFVKGLKSTISKYAALKDCADERLAREAKNALADLKWTAAAL